MSEKIESPLEDRIEPTRDSRSPGSNEGSSLPTKQISIGRCIQIIFVTAVIMATAFTMWTPANIFNNQFLNQMLFSRDNPQTELTPSPALEITITPSSPQKRIGIIAGHWKNDSGAVCEDGLTEVELNVRIATLVKQQLLDAGYEVDLLAEYDPKLDNFQGIALISIHNDSCLFYDEATGFKVAPATNVNHPEESNRLQACMVDRYEATTNLQYHANTVTDDMRDYHAFNIINPNTPAIIIETGFMNQDRDILTQHTDLVATGVANGILCYINNEPITTKFSTPAQ